MNTDHAYRGHIHLALLLPPSLPPSFLFLPFHLLSPTLLFLLTSLPSDEATEFVYSTTRLDKEQIDCNLLLNLLFGSPLVNPHISHQ